MFMKMFRKLFTIVYVAIALSAQRVKIIYREIQRVKASSYAKLTWPKRILKGTIDGTMLALIIGFISLFLSSMVMFVVFFATASALGTGLTNGMNEAVGRNRYRRYRRY